MKQELPDVSKYTEARGFLKEKRRFISEYLMIKIQDYLDGEAGVDLLEAALARILEEELDRLPSWNIKLVKE